MNNARRRNVFAPMQTGLKSSRVVGDLGWGLGGVSYEGQHPEPSARQYWSILRYESVTPEREREHYIKRYDVVQTQLTHIEIE